ncbi:MAG TPA: peptidylprolyl isomerase [Povalibacter sp.]|uniref:peptidylprolyl isomerase n=1 Tax=Povalibacter sp. TaxID=1962978 RepID=UPI002BF2A00D|nr:peptidylprolyl isomerase [Povalibacter sp.]HMN47086.1 peptidylprolyl isomerase [Povalibacter sp.]
MSTVLTSDKLQENSTVRAAKHLPGWAREPLLHFIVLGALLFAVDHWIISGQDDPNAIVFDAQAAQETRQLFETSRNRPPNADEMKALRQVWLDNEVLYREGLAQGLDKGDTAIRERVIFKALSMVDANTRLPPYDDEVLRQWFEQNRGRYDEPTRFTFQEAIIAGDTSEVAVRAFANALNAGRAPDAQADLRIFTGRPHQNIVQSYGAEFAAQLEASAPGEWRAINGGGQWRAMRLETTSPARRASFDDLRGVVLQDWTDATMAAQRSAAVAALAKKYEITIEEAGQ